MHVSLRRLRPASGSRARCISSGRNESYMESRNFQCKNSCRTFQGKTPGRESPQKMAQIAGKWRNLLDPSRQARTKITAPFLQNPRMDSPFPRPRIVKLKELVSQRISYISENISL